MSNGNFKFVQINMKHLLYMFTRAYAYRILRVEVSSRVFRIKKVSSNVL